MSLNCLRVIIFCVMNTDSHKIPLGISDYITGHFREDFLFEVKEIRNFGRHVVYTVEVSKDNYTHILLFNENGDLIKKEVSPSFPPDIHEEPGFEDIPE